MPTPESGTALPADALRRLLDRAEIGELLDRYVIAFDALTEEPLGDEWYRGVFTDDLVLTFPVGDHKGIEGLAEFQRAAKAKWARTHHMVSNHLIGLHGDEATVQARLLATHVHRGDTPRGHFTMGGRVQGTAVRTPVGWRLRQLAFGLVWRSGEAPAAPADAA